MKRSLVEEVEADLKDTEIWRWVRNENIFSNPDKQYEIEIQENQSKCYLVGMEKLFTIEDAQYLFTFVRKQISEHEAFKADQKRKRKLERLRRLFPKADLDIDGIAPPIKD